jgi:protocatechuate 3,4-dioxygenase beta subunit
MIDPIKLVFFGKLPAMQPDTRFTASKFVAWPLMERQLMRTLFATILTLLSCSSTSPVVGQTTEQVKTENITNIANIASIELQTDPGNREKWVKMHDILKIFYTELSKQERQVYRELLADLVQSPLTSTIRSDEPGTRLKISGRVSNLNGESVKNAQITVYSADSEGFYTPRDSITKSPNEPDARIMGFLRTDARGHFEIFTIRPASFPIPDNGHLLPAHVQLIIKAPGYQKKQVQMLFEDDPALDDYWRKWATDEGYPALKIEKTGGSFENATLNIVMKN